jgi:aspartyl-tRNA(Asn)/glutamyl-tRNA(Gln) amidotransferase subunit A
VTPDEALARTVSEVAPEVRAGRLTSVALAEASFQKLDTVGRELGSVASLARERSLEEARRADTEIAAGRYRGPLHGIPYGAKDLLATSGFPTTWGAGPLKEQILEPDATTIRRLRDAGAVLVAKLAMIELAGGLGYNIAAASATGAAKNPWDRSRWTCGSSSGSGAATAAGLVGFAIGSETWGSILCPSAFNGVTGLRPTYGLVPRTGAMALSWTMDKIGPMARSAEDCELVLDAIVGHDPADPGSLDEALPARSAADPRSFRVGAYRPSFEKFGSREVERAFDEAVKVFEGQGIPVGEVKLPDLPFDQTAILIIVVEAAAAFEPLITSGQVRKLADPGAYVNSRAARSISGVDYVRAMQARRILQQEMARLFESFDLIISPTVPMLATKLEEKLEAAFAYPDPLGSGGNLAGLPALSLPCGFSADGLPIGTQIVGPPLSERRVLGLGRWYQQRTEWHSKRPTT